MLLEIFILGIIKGEGVGEGAKLYGKLGVGSYRMELLQGLHKTRFVYPLWKSYSEGNDPLPPAIPMLIFVCFSE